MHRVKQRSKITALILALISLLFLPGIGQLFGGRLGRAFLLLGMMVAVTLCGVVGGMNDVVGAFIVYAVFFYTHF